MNLNGNNEVTGVTSKYGQFRDVRYWKSVTYVHDHNEQYVLCELLIAKINLTSKWAYINPWGYVDFGFQASLQIKSLNVHI